MFPIQPMCRASEAFKTEILKKGYKKIWTKNSNLIVKNKHNVSSKDLNFEFLAVVSGFKLEKKLFFFFKFFYFIPKNSLGFLIVKHYSL